MNFKRFCKISNKIQNISKKNIASIDCLHCAPYNKWIKISASAMCARTRLPVRKEWKTVDHEMKLFRYSFLNDFCMYSICFGLGLWYGIWFQSRTALKRKAMQWHCDICKAFPYLKPIAICEYNVTLVNWIYRVLSSLGSKMFYLLKWIYNEFTKSVNVVR